MTKAEILDVIKTHSPEVAASLIARVSLSEDAEERYAWDRYAAAGLHWNTEDTSQELANLFAQRADAMLSERRKRFGGKE